MTRGTILVTCLALMATPLAAKPSLRDVPRIDDGLFAVGLAHEIHKKCPTISARMLKGIGTLRALQSEARDLGYTDAEIRAHVDSRAEKQRLRARAADYMKQRGLGQTPQDYCALGRAEIAQQTDIGALLRTTQ